VPRLGADASRGTSPRARSAVPAGQSAAAAGHELPSHARRRKVQPAYVSLYLPFGRRTWHWYSYRCAVCGTYQLGRARRLEDVAGPRRAGCGHRLNVVVARIYQGAA
jgi:hypothetical protein